MLRALLLSGLLLLGPSLAPAAGLGELRVTSRLGQRLDGEIAVVAVKHGEELLSARIASFEDYAKAGLTRQPAVSDAQLSVVTVEGKSVILIKGNHAVYEPAVDLLVELSWPGGTVLRAYRILLDRPKS